MTEHTPGPWETATQGKWSTGSVSAASDEILIVAPNGARGAIAIAVLPAHPMAQYDASLLAAAPALLAAGEALYAAIGELEVGERPLENKAILAAGEAWCAAFRKAVA